MRFWPWCHLWHLIVLTSSVRSLQHFFRCVSSVARHLADRIQQVFTSVTGSPQGWVLSPVFHHVYRQMQDFSHEGSNLLKFSDDTDLLSLPRGPQSDRALISFLKWCNDNSFDLNLSKTKELINVLRKICVEPKASIKHDEDVQIVDYDTHLGTVFESQLKFDANRVYVKQRQQTKNCVYENILCNFTWHFYSYADSVGCLWKEQSKSECLLQDHWSPVNRPYVDLLHLSLACWSLNAAATLSVILYFWVLFSRDRNRQV